MVNSRPRRLWRGRVPLLLLVLSGGAVSVRGSDADATELPFAHRRLFSAGGHHSLYHHARSQLAELGASLHSEDQYHPHHCELRPGVESSSEASSSNGGGGLRGFRSVDFGWRRRQKERFASGTAIDRRAVFESFASYGPFLSADTILCQYPASDCETFMALNRSLLVLSAHRVDLNKPSPASRERWLANLRALSSVPGNVVAATSAYELQYVRTVAPWATVFPEVVPYQPNALVDEQQQQQEQQPRVSSIWLQEPEQQGPEQGAPPAPSSLARPFIVSRKADKRVAARAVAAAAARGVALEVTDDAYPAGYDWAALARHRGLVVVPYCVQSAFLGEAYRANVPMFVPSRRLLVAWHQELGIMWDRRASLKACVYFHGWGCNTTSGSISDRSTWRHRRAPAWREFDVTPLSAAHGHIAAMGSQTPERLSPDDDGSPEALEHWLGLSDWYQPYFREVVQYDSLDDLAAILEAATPASLAATSRRMASHNAALRRERRRLWARLLQLTERPRDGPRAPPAIPRSYDEGMRAAGFSPGITAQTIGYSVRKAIEENSGSILARIDDAESLASLLDKEEEEEGEGAKMTTTATPTGVVEALVRNDASVPTAQDVFLWRHCAAVASRLGYYAPLATVRHQVGGASPLPPSTVPSHTGGDDRRLVRGHGIVNGVVVVRDFPAWMAVTPTVGYTLTSTEYNEWSAEHQDEEVVVQKWDAECGTVKNDTMPASEDCHLRHGSLWRPAQSAPIWNAPPGVLGCFVDMNLTACIVVKSASSTVVSTSCDLLWGRVRREVTIPQPGVYEVQITIPELYGDRVIRTDTLDVRGGDASVEAPAPPSSGSTAVAVAVAAAAAAPPTATLVAEVVGWEQDLSFRIAEDEDQSADQWFVPRMSL